jgi:site-specific recombinase XerD
MKGCRPLTTNEVQNVARELARGPRSTRFRNLALFFLMLRSGLRISEALGLRVADVWDAHTVRSHLRLRGAAAKESNCVASLPLHSQVARVLGTYLRHEGKVLEPSAPLFLSRRSGGSLTRNGAWRFLREAIDRAGLEGPTGWFSTRKSYCHHLYEALDYDLEATRIGMRHAEAESTAACLQTDLARVEAAILALWESRPKADFGEKIPRLKATLVSRSCNPQAQLPQIYMY